MDNIKELLISLIPTGVSVASIVGGIKIAIDFVKTKFNSINDIYNKTVTKLGEHSEEIAQIKDLVCSVTPKLNTTIDELREQVIASNEEVKKLVQENKVLKEENASLKCIKDELCTVKQQLVVVLNERKN